MLGLGVLLLLLPFRISSVESITTADPVTTTAPPAPIPKYIVTNASGTCLMLQMDLMVNIRYYNEKGEEQYKDFYLNETSQQAIADGSCLPNYQLINLYWTPLDGSNETFSTTLNFSLAANSEHFSLTSITFNYSVSEHDFPGANNTNTSYSVSHDVTKFTCPLGYYYRCLAVQTFELDAGKSSTVLPKPLVLYEVSNMKVEAFRNSAKPDFIGKERMCTADYVPNRVIPIVVGVILALFILIAILVFIIGSRRRRVGYQTL